MPNTSNVWACTAVPEAALYSGHSQRVGFAVTAAEAGASADVIALVTRSLEMPRRCAQKADPVRRPLCAGPESERPAARPFAKQTAFRTRQYGHRRYGRALDYVIDGTGVELAALRCSPVASSGALSRYQRAADDFGQRQVAQALALARDGELHETIRAGQHVHYTL